MSRAQIRRDARPTAVRATTGPSRCLCEWTVPVERAASSSAVVPTELPVHHRTDSAEANTRVRQLIHQVHDAVPALTATLQSSDNTVAVTNVAAQLKHMLELAQALETAVEWDKAEDVCDQLQDGGISIAANIAKRSAALVESVQAVETLDQNIAEEVEELLSTVEGSLDDVSESFSLLRGVDRDVAACSSEVQSGDNPCFQMPLGDVQVEISNLQQSQLLQEYREQIKTHREQLEKQKRRHLTALEEQNMRLCTDQHAIGLAIQALVNQYEANSAMQNVVATKIVETTESLDQVHAAWMAAELSAKGPATRVENRMKDLLAHQRVMTQIELLHTSVVEQIGELAEDRDTFLKNSRTQLVLTQFETLSVAYSHIYRQVAKGNKRSNRLQDKLNELEEQLDDAECEEDVAGIQRLSAEIRRRESERLQDTTKITQLKEDLRQIDETLQKVIIAAAHSAGQPELAAVPVFYSDVEPPLQFDLEGKQMVHPRVGLLIEEMEQSTIEADKKEKKEKERLRQISEKNDADRSRLQKLKDLAITGISGLWR